MIFNSFFLDFGFGDFVYIISVSVINVWIFVLFLNDASNNYSIGVGGFC